MKQKKLAQKLLEASNKIYKLKESNSPKASYIHLSKKFLQKEADKRKISIKELIKIISTKISM